MGPGVVGAMDLWGVAVCLLLVRVRARVCCEEETSSGTSCTRCLHARLGGAGVLSVCGKLWHACVVRGGIFNFWQTFVSRTRY